MVTPDRTEPDHQRSRNGWGMAGALVVVLAALALIANLTEPTEQPPITTSPDRDTVAAPSTVPTIPPFDISQIEQGPPVEWRQTLDLIEERVIGATYQGGSFRIFTTDRGTPPDFHGAGLRMYSSAHGQGWTLTTVAGDDFNPSGVVASSGSLIVYGHDSISAPVVWSSTDGESWDSQALPGIDARVADSWFHAAYVDDDLAFLAAEVYADSNRMLFEELSDAYPGLVPGLTRGPFGTDEPTIVLTHPLGFNVLEIDPKEAGLDPEEMSEGSNSYRLVSWVRDGGRWRFQLLADLWDDSHPFSGFSSILAAPEGGALARVYGPQDWVTLATTDGVHWSGTDAQLPEWTTIWGDGYVSVTHHRGVPTLRTSPDLETWKDLDTHLLLVPEEGRTPSFEATVLEAGGAGVVLVVRDVDLRYPAPEPVQIDRDGYVLEIGEGLRLLRDGDVLIDQDDWWAPGRSPARLAPSGDAVTFSHPDHGELVTFTLAELRQLEIMSYLLRSTPEARRDHHALIFSPDGEEWSVSRLDDIVGAEEWVRLVVGPDRILLVAEAWLRGGTVWMGMPSG